MGGFPVGDTRYTEKKKRFQKMGRTLAEMAKLTHETNEYVERLDEEQTSASTVYNKTPNHFTSVFNDY